MLMLAASLLVAGAHGYGLVRSLQKGLSGESMCIRAPQEVTHGNDLTMAACDAADRLQWWRRNEFSGGITTYEGDYRMNVGVPEEKEPHVQLWVKAMGRDRKEHKNMNWDWDRDTGVVHLRKSNDDYVLTYEPSFDGSNKDVRMKRGESSGADQTAAWQRWEMVPLSSLGQLRSRAGHKGKAWCAEARTPETAHYHIAMRECDASNPYQLWLRNDWTGTLKSHATGQYMNVDYGRAKSGTKMRTAPLFRDSQGNVVVKQRFQHDLLSGAAYWDNGQKFVLDFDLRRERLQTWWYGANGASNQLWDFMPVEVEPLVGSIRSKRDGRCLERWGQDVATAPCSTEATQSWRYDYATGTIASASEDGSLALELKGEAAGDAVLAMAAAPGSANQAFTFDAESGEIRWRPAPKMVLRAADATLDDVGLMLYGANGQTDTKWEFVAPPEQTREQCLEETCGIQWFTNTVGNSFFTPDTTPTRRCSTDHDWWQQCSDYEANACLGWTETQVDTCVTCRETVAPVANTEAVCTECHRETCHTETEKTCCGQEVFVDGVFRCGLRWEQMCDEEVQKCTAETSTDQAVCNAGAASGWTCHKTDELTTLSAPTYVDHVGAERCDWHTMSEYLECTGFEPVVERTCTGGHAAICHKWNEPSRYDWLDYTNSGKADMCEGTVYEVAGSPDLRTLNACVQGRETCGKLAPAHATDATQEAGGRRRLAPSHREALEAPAMRMEATSRRRLARSHHRHHRRAGRRTARHRRRLALERMEGPVGRKEAIEAIKRSRHAREPEAPVGQKELKEAGNRHRLAPEQAAAEPVDAAAAATVADADAAEPVDSDPAALKDAARRRRDRVKRRRQARRAAAEAAAEGTAADEAAEEGSAAVKAASEGSSDGASRRRLLVKETA